MKKSSIALIPILVTLGACDMPVAEVLDAPRVLAVRAEPATFAPGEPLTLTALTFAVDGELAWSACTVAWSATDPPSCPSGPALDLGRGNPLETTAPADVGTLWVRVDAVGSTALPAMKLLEAGAAATNPTVDKIVQIDADTGAVVGPLPTTLARGATLDLAPSFGADTDPSTVVTSWYVTAGELDPKRTVGVDPATLTAPDAAQALRLIGVARTKAGGTSWVDASLEVGP